MARNSDTRLEQALETIDAGKRDSMRKLVIGTFVAPVVASFAIEGMMVTAASAASNTTTSNVT
jgi:hypothetical protein